MQLYRSDARHMPFIEDGTVQAYVTSPPYPVQRVYGDDEMEIGQGPSFDHYISEMIDVASEAARVLKPDGTFWLNIGHKSTASGGAGGDYAKGGEKEGKPKFGKFRDHAYQERQVMDVSLLVGQALQKLGWRWVTTIIWDKGVLERQDENHILRPALAHESILMLCPPGETRQKYHKDDTVEAGTVWHFKPGAPKGVRHLAPFPTELPRRCILLSTDEGDTVLDGFSGSHTTALVADSLDRKGIGVDLYADVDHPEFVLDILG
jgi:site-specific DNA-methyltransferase (cytosine-N4-specific)